MDFKVPRGGGDAVIGACSPGFLVDVDRVSKTAGGRFRAAARYRPAKSGHLEHRLGKALGSGASGPVRLATSRLDGRTYALKSLSKEGLPEDRLNYVRTEAEIHLSLDHPHIVKLEQVLETENEIHLLVEHMTGGEMHRRIRECKGGHFSEDQASSTARQMLRAVAYLHDQHVTHRDLKLENWLYEAPSSQHLRLIDFGLSQCRRASPGQKMTRSCGSVHYVAPEVLQRSYTEKADMWSLGVLVYMMLTGVPVFTGSNRDIIRKIRQREMELHQSFRKKCSSLAQDFVEKLLSFDPAGRLSAQEALCHPWLAEASVHLADPRLEAALLCGLRGLSSAPPLRRAVLTGMALSVSTTGTDELRSHFLAAGEDGRGVAERSGLAARLKAAGAGEDEVEALLATPGLGEGIAYTDYLAAVLCGGGIEVGEELLLRTFALFDRRRCGAISAHDVCDLLGGTPDTSAGVEDITLSRAPQCEDPQLKPMLEELQCGHAGSVGFDEFCSIVRTEVPTLQVRARPRFMSFLSVSERDSCFQPFKQLGSRIYLLGEDLAMETRHTWLALSDAFWPYVMSISLDSRRPSWQSEGDSVQSNFLL